MEGRGRIYELINAFDRVAKDCRLGQYITLGQLESLREAHRLVNAESARLAEASGFKNGLRVYLLPGFGYPELYTARVLDEVLNR